MQRADSPPRSQEPSALGCMTLDTLLSILAFIQKQWILTKHRPMVGTGAANDGHCPCSQPVSFHLIEL